MVLMEGWAFFMKLMEDSLTKETASTYRLLILLLLNTLNLTIDRFRVVSLTSSI